MFLYIDKTAKTSYIEIRLYFKKVIRMLFCPIILDLHFIKGGLFYWVKGVVADAS